MDKPFILGVVSRFRLYEDQKIKYYYRPGNGSHHWDFDCAIAMDQRGL